MTLNFDCCNEITDAYQERFLSRKSSESNDTTIYQWWVRLTHTNDFSAPMTSAWMSDKEQNKTLNSLGAKNDQWVIFNVNQYGQLNIKISSQLNIIFSIILWIKGYYRVAYDDTNYDLIRKQLISDHVKISPLNRGQLLDDALNLARANDISYANALDLTVYLAKERDYAPWHSALTALTYLDNILHSSPQFVNWVVNPLNILC